jgi:putative transcriptional regulator
LFAIQKRTICVIWDDSESIHIENLSIPRNIASEILEGIQEASDYLDGKPTRTRTTTINVPGRVDVRSIREGLSLTQAEFAARFAVPVDTLRKWERGVREPDAASRACLTLIQRNPKVIEETLAA